MLNRPKLEICLDARMIAHSGIGTYIKNIVLGFANGPFLLRLLIDPTTLPRFPWLASFEVIACPFPIYSIEEQIKLPLYIPKCDMFWSPHFNVPLLPIRAKKRLVTIHDVYHLAYIDSLKLKEKIYAQIVIQSAVRLSHKIISCSHFSKQEMQKYTGVSASKISVVYYGIDQDLFRPSSDQSQMEKIQEKYRLPERYVLFVGNVKPHKNLKGLLQAFSILLRNTAEYQLLIIGQKEGLLNSDDLAPLLQQDLQLSKAVRFLEFVPDEDLPFFYQLAQATVIPSFYEGFGFPILEAMSCGCPVLASHCASLPEVCGESALLFDPKKPEEIARNLEKLFADQRLRQRLRIAGFERCKLFSWQETIANHFALIERI